MSALLAADADGRRTRRKILGSEVWQVYGIDGELLAEYAASAAPSAPQKEYGYRNGELLVTAESAGQMNWIVSDHLGTPRIVADLSGTLANTKRHDYLPFGEEVGAGVGGRTTGQGYIADNVRQKFTSKERDAETEIDYFLARYYSSVQGRFTSPDEFTGGPDDLYYFVEDAADNPTFYAELTNPQSLNKYQYAYNNPLRYVDPDGHRADDLLNQEQKQQVHPPYGTSPVERQKKWNEEKDTFGRIVRCTRQGNCPDVTKPVPIPSMSDKADGEVGAEVSTGEDPDNKPDTSENTNKGGSEGRDSRKVNKKRAASAKDQVEQLRQKLAEVESRPNKTPADKKERDTLKAAIRKQLDRARKSETHGRRGK
jgi:RHS repeat-associated protein